LTLPPIQARPMVSELDLVELLQDLLTGQRSGGGVGGAGEHGCGGDSGKGEATSHHGTVL